jgi:ribosomal protein S13
METEGIDVAQPVSVLNDDDIENLKREIKEDTATYKDLRETIIKLFP